jgi:hypothetical protein
LGSARAAVHAHAETGQAQNLEKWAMNNKQSEAIAKPQKGGAKPTGQDVHVGRKTSNAAAKVASAVGLSGCLGSLKALRALSPLHPPLSIVHCQLPIGSSDNLNDRRSHA